MSITASQIFEFLDRAPTCHINRIEFSRPQFSVLRRDIRTVVLALRESDSPDALETANRLWLMLSEWLTAPIPFDDRLLDAVLQVGEGTDIRARWGTTVANCIEEAREAALDLWEIGNPVRTAVQNRIACLRQQNLSFRIFCHRSAVPYYESLVSEAGGAPLGRSAFLHSVRDYRESPPFDVLVKVGPLRSRGWGATPDAVLAAHRFSELSQFVWAGCGDEPGFGSDPVAVRAGFIGEAATRQVLASASPTLRLTEDLVRSPGAMEDEDDLQLLSVSADSEDRRPAALLQIDEEHCLLVPPHSGILSFDPAEQTSQRVARRTPVDTLKTGMYLVHPVISEADLGGVQTGEGPLSQVWKARLREEYKKDPETLLRRLKEAGVDLLQLRGCIEHWCRPASTVIHAPQRKVHFAKLVDVLDLDSQNVMSGRQSRPWWQRAWREIQHARGKAIQLGMQEHEIIDEELIEALHMKSAELKDNAATGENFVVQLPAERSLQGHVEFIRLDAVEEGYLVPAWAVNNTSDMDTVEQWRV